MESAWSSLGPAHWSALTHKRVAVLADNGQEHRGLVVTVDPVTASVVLLDQAEVRLVLGHAVKKVEILDQDSDPEQLRRLETLFRESQSTAMDPGLDLDQTRARLLDWIRLNHVPVETQGAGLAVAGGVVTVKPPFRPEDCVGLNQVVLDRVQRLIRNWDRDRDQVQDQDKVQDRD